MAPTLEMWYAALGSPLGVIVETDDTERCKQKLYALRATANDPDLESISICTSPTNLQHLWLVKKAPNEA